MQHHRETRFASNRSLRTTTPAGCPSRASFSDRGCDCACARGRRGGLIFSSINVAFSTSPRKASCGFWKCFPWIKTAILVFPLVHLLSTTMWMRSTVWRTLLAMVGCLIDSVPHTATAQCFCLERWNATSMHREPRRLCSVLRQVFFWHLRLDHSDRLTLIGATRNNVDCIQHPDNIESRCSRMWRSRLSSSSFFSRESLKDGYSGEIRRVERTD